LKSRTNRGTHLEELKMYANKHDDKVICFVNKKIKILIEIT